MFSADLGFKPQRGKFTHIALTAGNEPQACFKPQRGKFTRSSF